MGKARLKAQIVQPEDIAYIWEEVAPLLEKVKDYGWSVNPDTRKLQKIVGTKALNKTQTMGKQRGENNG